MQHPPALKRPEKTVDLSPSWTARHHAMSLFEELKRRNVFRVGIAYAVSAWVLLQVVDLVLDNTDIPGWVMQAFMLLAALGFVVALVVSWAFEVTPEGIKREKDVGRSESITRETGQKLNIVTLAAAALVLVLFAVDRMLPKHRSPRGGRAWRPPGAEWPKLRPSEADGSAIPLPTCCPHRYAQARGVAVLPFENLSEEAGQRLFRRRHARGRAHAHFPHRRPADDFPHLHDPHCRAWPGRARNRPPAGHVARAGGQRTARR